jgi:3-oxoacyl-[acyl-carrier protein] reductase
MAGQVVLVTGGGGGIGSAICRRLAAAGARVVINYRSDDARAQQTIAGLTGEGHLALQASVTASDQLAALAARLRADYGRLDLLVNNAGITTPVPHGDLDSLTDDWIDRIFATNWRGAFATVRAMRPLLADGGGTVVNISSIAGQSGVGSNVAYCASKAALDSMTRSLARALAPAIRVVSVAPGWVLGEYAQRFPADYIQAQKEATPLKDLATPEQVADAVWAVHTTLTFTTGVALTVGGGRLLGI